MKTGLYKINTPFIMDCHYELFKHVKDKDICDKLVVFLATTNKSNCSKILNNIKYVDLVTSDLLYDDYDILISDNYLDNNLNKEIYIVDIPIKHNFDNICCIIYDYKQTNARDNSRLYW